MNSKVQDTSQKWRSWSSGKQHGGLGISTRRGTEVGRRKQTTMQVIALNI